MAGPKPSFPIADHTIAWDIRRVSIAKGRFFRPVPEIRRHIEKRRREKPLSFDGTAWRLCSLHWDITTRNLMLAVGKGLYSQYRWTSLDPELRQEIPEPSKWFSALALGAVVITRDGKIVLFRRPDTAHLAPNTWDIPCGHPSSLRSPPSTQNIRKALRIVLTREFGYEWPSDFEMEPLLLAGEEPKSAYDLVYRVHTTLESNEIKERYTKAEKVCFVGASQWELELFLLEPYALSRPTALALAYFGRMQYGEEWFMRHCLEKN